MKSLELTKDQVSSMHITQALHTMSASSYSSKTSKVERRLPLKIVGSSVCNQSYPGDLIRLLTYEE